MLRSNRAPSTRSYCANFSSSYVIRIIYSGQQSCVKIIMKFQNASMELRLVEQRSHPIGSRSTSLSGSISRGTGCAGTDSCIRLITVCSFLSKLQSSNTFSILLGDNFPQVSPRDKYRPFWVSMKGP